MTKLIGKKEIMREAGRTWRTLLVMKDELNFPMKKIKGRWESDKDLVNDWRKKQIIE